MGNNNMEEVLYPILQSGKRVVLDGDDLQYTCEIEGKIGTGFTPSAAVNAVVTGNTFERSPKQAANEFSEEARKVWAARAIRTEERAANAERRLAAVLEIVRPVIEARKTANNDIQVDIDPSFNCATIRYDDAHFYRTAANAIAQLSQLVKEG